VLTGAGVHGGVAAGLPVGPVLPGGRHLPHTEGRQPSRHHFRGIALPRPPTLGPSFAGRSRALGAQRRAPVAPRLLPVLLLLVRRWAQRRSLFRKGSLRKSTAGGFSPQGDAAPGAHCRADDAHPLLHGADRRRFRQRCSVADVSWRRVHGRRHCRCSARRIRRRPRPGGCQRDRELQEAVWRGSDPRWRRTRSQLPPDPSLRPRSPPCRTLRRAAGSGQCCVAARFVGSNSRPTRPVPSASASNPSSAGADTIAGPAPGRVNLIGEHTDYNDG